MQELKSSSVMQPRPVTSPEKCRVQNMKVFIEKEEEKNERLQLYH